MQLAVQGNEHKASGQESGAALSPLYFAIGFSVGLVPTTGFGAVGLYLPLLVMAVGITLSRKIGKSKLVAAGALGASSLLMTLGLMISSAFSKHGDFQSLVVAIQYLVAFCFAPIAVILFSVKREAEEAVRGFVYGTFVLMSVALFTYFFLHDFGRSMNWIQANFRLRLWFGANSLPALVIVGLFGAVFWWKIRNDNPILLAVYGILAFVTIVLSGSNSGIMQFSVAVLVILIVLFPKACIIALPPLSLGLYLVIENLAYLVDLFQIDVLRRFLWVVEGDFSEAGSMQGRSFIIFQAIEHIKDYPFLGMGGGMGAHAIRESADFSSRQAHNLFVLIWLEGGLLAIAGLGLWLFSAARFALILPRQVGYYLVGFLGVMCVLWMTRTHSYQIYYTLPYFLMIMCAIHRPESPVRPPDRIA